MSKRCSEGPQGWHVSSVAGERLPSQQWGQRSIAGVQMVAVLSLQLPGQRWDELLQSSPDVWRGPGEPEVFSMVSVGEEPHLEQVLYHLPCLLRVNSDSEHVSPGVKIYSLAHFDQGTEMLLAMDETVGG